MNTQEMNTQKINELEEILLYLKKYGHIHSYKIDRKYRAAIVYVNSIKELISLVSVLGRIGAFYNIITMDENRNEYRLSIINFNNIERYN